MTITLEDLQIALYRAGCHVDKNRNTSHNIGKTAEHAALDQINRYTPSHLVVVSANDFPDSVWTTQEEADKYIKHKRSLEPKRNHGPITYWHSSSLPMYERFVP